MSTETKTQKLTLSTAEKIAKFAASIKLATFTGTLLYERVPDIDDVNVNVIVTQGPSGKLYYSIDAPGTTFHKQMLRTTSTLYNNLVDGDFPEGAVGVAKMFVKQAIPDIDEEELQRAYAGRNDKAIENYKKMNESGDHILFSEQIQFS